MTDSVDLERLTPDLTVLTADGESLGTISSIEGTYLVVTKGVVFTGTTYVPISAVATVDEADVRLGLTGGEVRAAAWDQVPEDFRAGAAMPDDAGEEIPQSRSNTAAIRDDQAN